MNQSFYWPQLSWCDHVSLASFIIIIIMNDDQYIINKQLWNDFLQLFSDKLRDLSSSLEFSMVPGDLVAFNNRRVLHGRTAFNPTKVDRWEVLYYSLTEWSNDKGLLLKSKSADNPYRPLHLYYIFISEQRNGILMLIHFLQTPCWLLCWHGWSPLQIWFAPGQVSRDLVGH